jgi:predicted ATPase
MVTRFGEYEIDHDRYELRRAGVVVSVERRVFDLILYLVKNASRVITKSELLSSVWDGRHVAEGSLSVAITAARRALGDDAETQRVIRTCRGRGYQFVSPCTVQHGVSSSGDRDREVLESPNLILIGREAEIAVLSEAADRLQQGHSTVLLLSGEPGIGKTRLLDEFFRLANALGFATALGRCSESGDAPAMWPWSQIFRSLHRRIRRESRAMFAQRSLQATAMIAPELVAGQWNPQLPSRAPEIPRFQLYEGLLDTLETLVCSEKLVIALDDLHRADTSTLGFLRFAIRELRHLPVVFLATSRVGELRHSPDHSQTIAELSREPHAVSIRLKGLDPKGTASLFAVLSSQRTSLQTANDLFRQTGGNPFFIRQLASLAASWGERDSSRSKFTLPPTLRLAILEQLSSLDSTARLVLGAAAVAGREASARMLEDTVGLESRRFAAVLDELVDSLVLRRDPNEPDRLAFAHVLVRDALYESLGIAERRLLHEKIGESLLAQFGAMSEPHLPQIAYHLFEAQTTRTLTKARYLSEAAARAASARSAHDDAERHYGRALQALAGCGKSPSAGADPAIRGSFVALIARNHRLV